MGPNAISGLQVPSILVNTLGIGMIAQGSEQPSYAGKAALLLVMIDEEQWLHAC